MQRLTMNGTSSPDAGHDADGWARARLVMLMGGIAAFAVAVRWAFVFESNAWWATVRSPPAGLDVDLTWRAARLLVEAPQIRPRFELMIQSSPLPVATTALMMKAIGFDPFTHRLLVSALHCLRFPVLFGLLMRSTRDVVAAAVATVAVASAPSVIYFDSTLGKGALELTLLTIACALPSFGAQPGRPLRSVMRGLVLGAICVCLAAQQLNLVLCALPILVASAQPDERTLRERLIEIGVGVAVITVAVLGFQHLRRADDASHSAFLPRSGADLKVAIQSSQFGTYQSHPGIAALPWGHAFGARIDAEVRHGRALTPGQADERLRREAWDYAAAHPAELARRTVQKLRAFVAAYEIGEFEEVEALMARSLVLGHTPVHFGVFFVMAILGVPACLRSNRRQSVVVLGLLGAVAAACLGMYVNWRYRLPALAPMAVLVGFAVRDLRTRWVTWRARATMAIFAVPAIAATMWPMPEALRARLSAAGAANEASALAAESEADVPPALFYGDSGATTATDSATLATRTSALSRLHRYSEAFHITRQLVARREEGAQQARLHLRFLLWLGNEDAAWAYLRSIDARSDLRCQALLLGDAAERRRLEQIIAKHGGGARIGACAAGPANR